MDYNKVIIGGTLTRDPELRVTAGGTSVCEAGVAINKKWTDQAGQRQESTCFVDVTIFGKTAETVAKYFSKGGQILLEGELRLDKWEDRETGRHRSKLGMVAHTFQFCNRNEGGGGDGDGQRSDPQPARREEREPARPREQCYDEGNEEDDIPF